MTFWSWVAVRWDPSGCPSGKLLGWGGGDGLGVVHLATVQGIITQDAMSLSNPEAWVLGYEGSEPLLRHVHM